MTTRDELVFPAAIKSQLLVRLVARVRVSVKCFARVVAVLFMADAPVARRDPLPSAPPPPAGHSLPSGYIALRIWMYI